ncbi:MAG: DUF4229 domain-containing protein [Actinobacteria bacterium]|nr:DUF4229 domain-containing protein [Actinomycetota bacterium]
MRPVLLYTVARLAVLALVVIVLSLTGLQGFPLLLVALALSMPVSYLALGRQRVGLTEWIESRRAQRAELRRKLRGDE